MASSPAWTAPAVDRRENIAFDTERESLDHFLEWQRETLLWKCAGLTGEQLASRPLPTTELSLAGLIRHMAAVERWWFRIHFLGQKSLEILYETEEDRDSDFHAADADSAEADYAIYLEEVDQVRRAVAGHGLDEMFESRRGRMLTLRWVCLHMIQEYARHAGHADLLREAIDGATGY